MEKYHKATNFEFTSYVFEPEKRKVVFCYKTEFDGQEPIIWQETIILPESLPKDIVQQYNEKFGEKYFVIKKILESLHIMLGISYYKFYCAPKFSFSFPLATPMHRCIGVATDQYAGTEYFFTKKEAEFWDAVYKKGLGEFFYRNKLNPNIFPKFPCVGDIVKIPEPNEHQRGALTPNARYLIGVSGGKDSIVGVELLKEAGENLTAFYVETNKRSKLVDDVINLTGLSQLKIQRILDEKVFQKHQYSGHIPISAIYAFLGVFASVLYGYNGFVVSNEHSSNFGNLRYNGSEINHQWSKSLEFEKIFSGYIKKFISSGISYFSILRPFYEIRIAKMFSKYPRYFQAFSSCNKNFKIASLKPMPLSKPGFDANKSQAFALALHRNNITGLWCGKCAKCVFVFILLSAFLSKKELIEIFGKNLYKDRSLLQLFKDVLGFGKIKPFDCVGTFKESQTAFKMASKKYKADFIVRQLGGRARIYPEVFKIQEESGAPEQFKFLGLEKVLILGYGKEGTATKKYLQKYYPKLKIGIADEKLQGKNYLKKQENFDIAVKTPGIKKELVKIPHTTATNMFFSKVSSKNKTIGITGSKGKSTTASLIYEILKTAGKNVDFLGNIGKPMLDYLLNNEPKDKIFVLELSSYQLDDIKFSPDIAVVTNLFPEHMDFHGSLKNYYNAKKNIINFQNKNNYFVFQPKNKIIKKWLKDYKGKAVPAINIIPQGIKIPLLGEHNIDNTRLAVAVAKIFDISDKTIKKAVENFRGLPHRLEFVGEFKGIKFYDDAISTTPESTIMAIRSLPKIGTIFLGGQDRGYNFLQLARIIKKSKIKNIVLFPDSGKKIKSSLRGAQATKQSLNFFETSSMQEAVKFAYKNTEKGSICLLSCASPSYSLWKNFEEKGDQFQKFIKKLANEKTY